MSRIKKILIALLVVLAAAAAGMAWLLTNYHVVGFQLYRKDTTSLDLRGQEISMQDYETLCEKLPGAEIRWDVPYRDTLLKDDVETIEIVNMSDEDILVLDHLKNLRVVNARGTDFAQYAALQQRRPDLQVKYYIPFSGQQFYQGTTRVEADSVDLKQLELLQYLPRLDTVVLKAGGNLENVEALREYCEEHKIGFYISTGGDLIPADTKKVTVSGVTDEELALLAVLTEMKTLHIRDPKASAENVLALQKTYPNVKITWEVTIGGETFEGTVTEVDLSMVEIEDLAEVERQMAYLPKAEKLILGVCGIDNEKWGNSKSKLAASEIENEDLAAYRDRVREDYKVVWTVRLGPNIALRTDADNFMPNHFGVGVLTDEYAYNLKYCEDMVCLDVGHMTLTDIFFVEYMPKLKYLILAWTEVQYIEPIRTCKNLIWLELDNSCIRDYSPLVDCTALQDLNIGKTYCDIEPILEMTWLKNLYMIFCSGGKAWQASQALPDTRVVASGNATVGGGWRRLPNYYDMRDCLGMYYMN